MPDHVSTTLTADVHGQVRRRLEMRRPEIEQMVMARIDAVSLTGPETDPEYRHGLRATVSAALDYGIAAIEGGDDEAPSIPAVLLAQARLAARNGIALDTVMRRYFAGYAFLGDCLIESASEDRLLEGAALKQLSRALANAFDRLLGAVGEEHGRQAESCRANPEQRRSEQVDRLLAGEWLDTSDFAYDFGGLHLGAIAAGHGADEMIRTLAKALDRRLLSVNRADGVVWAWLGAQRQFDPDEIERHVSDLWPKSLSLALGEPGWGPAGWRLTHQQARATLPIARRSPQTLVRYADVALLASMLQDDLLATSLRRLYLDPLSRERDGGETLRNTLRAYFGTARSVSSAAGVLGVSRQTVGNRLHTIEERLKKDLRDCGAELEAALRLDGWWGESVDVGEMPTPVGRSLVSLTKRRWHRT